MIEGQGTPYQGTKMAYDPKAREQSLKAAGERLAQKRRVPTSAELERIKRDGDGINFGEVAIDMADFRRAPGVTVLTPENLGEDGDDGPTDGDEESF